MPRQPFSEYPAAEQALEADERAMASWTRARSLSAVLDRPVEVDVTRLGALLLLVIVAGIACALSRAEESFQLPVFPGAVEVVRNTQERVLASVGYQVKEFYPAPRTIDHLRQAMARRGWRIVEKGPFKPRWTQTIDAERSLGSPHHVWQAQWRNRIGDEVAYSDGVVHAMWQETVSIGVGP